MQQLFADRDDVPDTIHVKWEFTSDRHVGVTCLTAQKCDVPSDAALALQVMACFYD